MSDMEETDFIGKTYFIDENGKQVDALNYRGKILIVNFPGSGMCLSSKNRQEVNNSASRANDATKKLILENNSLFQLGNCSFYTAVYENKADKAIKEYNDENKIHTEAIFEQVVSSMISDNYNQTHQALSCLIFRGHCFGAMVISELEVLLEKRLQQSQFNQKQIKDLLSAPKVLISSPALKISKYPKYFQTVAIVNNSDRTITSEENCGEELKRDLMKLANFEESDLVFLKARRVANLGFLPKLPDIKISYIVKDNICFSVCNHAPLPESYKELEEDIKKHMASKGLDTADNECYLKYLKKKLNGHEFNFLPVDQQKYFSNSLKNAILTARNSAFSRSFIQNKYVSSK